MKVYLIMPEINGYNTPYFYEYQPTGATTNNYYISASTKPASPINMEYSSKMKETTVTGGIPYKATTSNGMAKKVIRKVFSPFRKIRANHIIMLCVLGLTCANRGLFSSNQKPSVSGGMQYTETAYQRGMQQVRDSVKIANLEKELKLAQDSVKLLKKAVK